MKTKIKDYLSLVITFSVAIAIFLMVFLFIQPLIQSLINKFIVFMTSSQIGRIITVIIVFGEIILGGYLVYSMLTYQRKEEVLNLGEKWK